MNKALKGLYVITDTNIQSDFDHIELAKNALKGGARLLQIRDKKLDTRSLMRIGAEVTRLCDNYGALCILNDRADIAAATGVHGVHLGQNDLPIPEARKLLGNTKVIGGTASTLEEALEVEKAGADYIGFGHIFETTTKKKDYEPRGVDLLGEVCRKIRIPVFGIGGINQENTVSVMETGAAGVVVCSEVCTAPNPEQATRSLVEKVERTLE